ncbi:MAG TPA: bifunctional glutamate N-acetyltransferase/amino-acid acetyltransferase ArgJ [Symbiobacteriaceae bacterium]|nr:bifunctional glutamate N-acetyltransferase/amino-acid acetyltransferase ArgJ [Symbiobacteriaceae bacterium]
MQEMKGGITAPAGFLAAGVHANIKGKGGTKKDVAVLFSKVPCAAAGVYTTNKVKAAPVVLSQARTATGRLQAVVINSGNANACTGEQGMQDAETMAVLTAKALGLEPSDVAVASTGVIGVPLPMDRVKTGIATVAASVAADGGQAAAEAIMTTDTFDKQYAVQVELGGALVTIGAMAKGSGMIHPNMATMLGFLTTDADVDAGALHVALKAATEKSFNMITVDGDTSTNDMVIALANGMAKNTRVVLGSTLYDAFAAALEQVLIHLAKEVARDGEGATKLVEMRVKGAPTVADARKAAKAVCGSMLTKAAVFGEDANWGRVLCAMGYSGAEFDPAKVDLWLGDVPLMQAGTPLAFDEAAAALVLKEKTVVFTADLHSGTAEATAWGCDLTYDYVKINGSYRT